ncbi:hypothetical protein AVEN_256524-1 [Araneus ventricosus]|uniref:Uncharacterized protein n=1 Tax=Araneus ventricosus TaxID=182803 RepID=A0A4Y2LKF9_ARAVE|nr:hypothetical protein AVEN_256524-1 [Araneus ventricosus]
MEGSAPEEECRGGLQRPLVRFGSFMNDPPKWIGLIGWYQTGRCPKWCRTALSHRVGTGSLQMRCCRISKQVLCSLVGTVIVVWLLGPVSDEESYPGKGGRDRRMSSS